MQAGRVSGPVGRQPDGRSTLVIAVATYHRPADIDRCVGSLRAERRSFLGGHDGWDVGILVVDNDAEGSARATVATAGGPELRYVVEAEPGISAARNRALRESEAADVLIFLDDDEEAVPGWLGHLLSTFERWHPAAVAGRVVSAFAQEPDPWIEAGGFFRRRTLPTGTPVQVAATNNLLLDLHVVRALGLQFGQRYGLTGGGDTHFTRRLVELGEQIVWCDEAVVIDHVPESRLTREWVLARARRTGNTEVAIGLALAPTGRVRTARRARAVVRGSVRVVGGTLQAAVGRLTRSVRLNARGAKAMNRGRGMLVGAVGRTIGEYERTAAPASTVPVIRVLASFPQPRPTTNPYIVQLAAALDATPGVELIRFSRRAALLGTYDVVHMHWPENLVVGNSTARGWVRQLLFGLLLIRWRIGRVPVVRTRHNVAPHDDLTVGQRFLLARLDGLTRGTIVLNAADAHDAGATLIPHGHYLDWFAVAAAAADRPDQEPGSIVFAGLIRPYKNVDGLIGAFRAVADPDLRLRVVGRPDTDRLARQLRAAAAPDHRISLDLRFLSDPELAVAIARAQMVALPYRDMHNSGAAILALSLNRPILVPDNELNHLLAGEVGEPWVQFFGGELTAEDLTRALDRTAGIGGGERPDLSARSWAVTGSYHAEVYRAALTDRRSVPGRRRDRGT